MRRDAFKTWLQEAGLRESSARTYLSDAKRVDDHYGDLDDLYDEDQCRGVLAELEYSKEDERRGRANPSKIPIDAESPYNGLQGYKAALVKYCDFRQGNRTQSTTTRAWDEYLRAANHLIENGTLRREEGYKDELASAVTGVRVALLGG